MDMLQQYSMGDRDNTSGEAPPPAFCSRFPPLCTVLGIGFVVPGRVACIGAKQGGDLHLNFEFTIAQNGHAYGPGGGGNTRVSEGTTVGAAGAAGWPKPGIAPPQAHCTAESSSLHRSACSL